MLGLVQVLPSTMALLLWVHLVMMPMEISVGQHTFTIETFRPRNGSCNKSVFQMMEQKVITLVGVLQSITAGCGCTIW